MLVGAFQKAKGKGYTLENLRVLFNHPYIDAYKTSIEISLVTALIGGVVGLFVAYAAIRDGTPAWIRSGLTTFSGVAANFGGIPLAFAFIATLGLPQLNDVSEQMRLRMDQLFDAGYAYTYLYPGLQKVIQAAGRVIRTRHDRGVVYLIDDRFGQREVRELLPKWWKLRAPTGNY